MPKPQRASLSTQPHDTLFKWIFSQREHAVGLLKAALPKALTEAVEWQTLRLEKGSFVDRALRHRHSDLVFSARLLGRPLYFYTLLEHQRDVEALMVFRMGVYMMRLWEQLVRDRPTAKKLPPIMPILLHHSKTGWTAATAFQDIIEAEGAVRAALSPHIPSFKLCLIDLSAGRADGLVNEALTALGRAALWCMSVAGDDARLMREIERFTAALEEVLLAKDGLAALEPLLRYLLATHPRISLKKIVEKTAGSRAQEAIMTELDEIERRGERRGMRKGRAEVLLEQLTTRFGPVADDVRARVMAANEAKLTRWTVRVLNAPTLEEVLEDSGRRPSPARRPAVRKRAARI